MGKVKLWINRLSFGQKMLSLTVFLCLMIFFIITVYKQNMINALKDQQAAVRWDEKGQTAQVSSFFGKETAVDEMQIKNFEHEMETALKDAAVNGENNANARLFVDAYSSMGKITIASEQGTIEANAVGIGGDFFLFHPLTLLEGSYFSGNDLMKDSVILDEDAAWQLFGSNQIAGKSVMIGNTPHYIVGVVKRENGRLQEAAGLDQTVVYVSHETLSAFGDSGGISTYELIAPNPVKGFVLHTVKEKFGLQETEMVVVENSARFSLEAILSVIMDFGIRSMQDTAVQFPYWENVARGYEDICAVLLIFQGFFICIPAGILFSIFVINRKEMKRQMIERIKSWKGRRR